MGTKGLVFLEHLFKTESPNQHIHTKPQPARGARLFFFFQTHIMEHNHSHSQVRAGARHAGVARQRQETLNPLLMMNNDMLLDVLLRSRATTIARLGLTCLSNAQALLLSKEITQAIYHEKFNGLRCPSFKEAILSLKSKQPQHQQQHTYDRILHDDAKFFMCLGHFATSVHHHNDPSATFSSAEGADLPRSQDDRQGGSEKKNERNEHATEDALRTTNISATGQEAGVGRGDDRDVDNAPCPVETYDHASKTGKRKRSHLTTEKGAISLAADQASDAQTGRKQRAPLECHESTHDPNRQSKKMRRCGGGGGAKFDDDDDDESKHHLEQQEKHKDKQDRAEEVLSVDGKGSLRDLMGNERQRDLNPETEMEKEARHFFKYHAEDHRAWPLPSKDDGQSHARSMLPAMVNAMLDTGLHGHVWSRERERLRNTPCTTSLYDVNLYSTDLCVDDDDYGDDDAEEEEEEEEDAHEEHSEDDEGDELEEESLQDADALISPVDTAARTFFQLYGGGGANGKRAGSGPSAQHGLDMPGERRVGKSSVGCNSDPSDPTSKALVRTLERAAERGSVDLTSRANEKEAVAARHLFVWASIQRCRKKRGWTCAHLPRGLYDAIGPLAAMALSEQLEMSVVRNYHNQGNQDNQDSHPQHQQPWRDQQVPRANTTDSSAYNYVDDYRGSAYTTHGANWTLRPCESSASAASDKHAVTTTYVDGSEYTSQRGQHQKPQQQQRSDRRARNTMRANPSHNQRHASQTSPMALVQVSSMRGGIDGRAYRATLLIECGFGHQAVHPRSKHTVTHLQGPGLRISLAADKDHNIITARHAVRFTIDCTWCTDWKVSPKASEWLANKRITTAWPIYVMKGTVPPASIGAPVDIFHPLDNPLAARTDIRLNVISTDGAPIWRSIASVPVVLGCSKDHTSSSFSLSSSTSSSTTTTTTPSSATAPPSETNASKRGPLGGRRVFTTFPNDYEHYRNDPCSSFVRKTWTQPSVVDLCTYYAGQSTPFGIALVMYSPSVERTLVCHTVHSLYSTMVALHHRHTALGQPPPPSSSSSSSSSHPTQKTDNDDETHVSGSPWRVVCFSPRYTGMAAFDAIRDAKMIPSTPCGLLNDNPFPSLVFLLNMARYYELRLCARTVLAPIQPLPLLTRQHYRLHERSAQRESQNPTLVSAAGGQLHEDADVRLEAAAADDRSLVPSRSLSCRHVVVTIVAPKAHAEEDLDFSHSDAFFQGRRIHSTRVSALVDPRVTNVQFIDDYGPLHPSRPLWASTSYNLPSLLSSPVWINVTPWHALQVEYFGAFFGARLSTSPHPHPPIRICLRFISAASSVLFVLPLWWRWAHGAIWTLFVLS